LPQLFADIRTNWTPESIEKELGVKIREIIPRGFIDKRNSGAAALDYAVNIFKLLSLKVNTPISHISSLIRNNKDLQQTLIEKAIKATRFCGAFLEYFRGDGLSSSFRTPGDIPITAYRYNVVGDMLTCSIVEGETVELPKDVADYVNKVTDETWPEMFWAPRNISSFEYMSKIGPNHDGNSFGHIGADLITLNAMLRIPIDLHNISTKDIFRPTMWDRYNGDDFMVCKELGSLYL
jgi:L-fucose isomerase